MKYTIGFFILVSGLFVLACSPAGGNKTGHEFMPDMVHPTGYEANLYDYYYYNRWGTKEEYKSYVMPRMSVPGTVARGEISAANALNDSSRMKAMGEFSGIAEGSLAMVPNGSVPYYYGNNEDERKRAMREITRNPFPITAASLTRGQELYTIYCSICHGDNANGVGYLVREADPAKGIVAGIYPAAPANLTRDTFINASPGFYYHAIMYGKNVMGSYADKLTYSERWDVIHYIRSLQAKAKKLEYSENANTLNKEAVTWNTQSASMKTTTTAVPDTSGTVGHGQSGNNMNQQ